MNISEQLDTLNKLMEQSYCEHLHITPLEPGASKIKGIDNPLTCDDCGKIIECEHDGDIDIHGYSSYCVDCGADVTDYDQDYRKEF